MKFMSDASIKKLFLLFEKLKKDKKTFAIVLLGVSGILLISFSELLPAEERTADKGYTQTAVTDSNEKEELESIIGKIKGVGRVEVMINYEGTAENIYANNTSQQLKDSESKTQEEHIIIDKGSGEDGLLVKSIYPRVTGVAVVCEGGGSPTVKNDITQLLKALYNISSNSISISEMSS